MKKLACLIALVPGLALAAGSTVNPTIPVANSPLQSAPVRGNFAAAASDINSLIQINAGTTAPATPLLGQQWLNTAATPYVWNVFDGAVWDILGTLNASTNKFQAGSVPWSGVTGTPTTLSGYGITNGVSSVGVTMPSAFSCAGSPVTSSGTIACAFAAQSQAYFLASPSSSTGTPLMRQIVATDIPTLNQNTTGNAATVTTNANLTGDVTSVGNATTIAPTGVTAGTYAQVTVNAKGQATAAVALNTVPFGGTGVGSISGIVKGAGTGPFVTATSGTDYIAPGGAFGTPSSLTCTNCSGTAAGLSIGGTVNGNTLTAGSSTYTGSAGQTYTFPTTSASVARTDAAQTFTGLQTFTGNITNAAVAGGQIIAGQFLFAGQTGTGTGGNTRYTNDAGTSNWLTGLLGSAGATNFSIYDLVNSAARLTINSSTGNVLVGTSTDNAADKLQVLGTASVANAGASLVKVSSSGGSGSGMQLLGYTGSHSNWQIDTGILGASINFTPSTTLGGSAFTTPTVQMTSTQTISNVPFNAAAGLSNGGNLVISTTAPTLASGGCSTASMTTTSGTAWFTATNAGTCTGSQPMVFTLPAAAHSWHCTARDVTTPGHLLQTGALSTTSVTITNYALTTGLAQAWTTGDVVEVSCIGG